ncbi:hypothetical protein [Thermoanaerobacterium sp. RBIITD]|uniref:hypothetical protein n=1 Tax=Thermoanaerobacterium sp. RBIITD TaxID=1550240 RepID=UPI000BB86B70|nr:hypothetical protein [Thermoanaerobacterium sp. RBIITD]
MEIQIGIKKQFRYLALPIIWHILDLFLASSISKVYRIYLEFVFYTGLSLYFIAIGSISFKSLLDE